MFEEEDRILKADGRARGTEIGNKIYEKWFTTAKKHAKLTLEGGGVQMLDTTREVVTFLMRMDDKFAYMGEDYEYTQGEFLRHTEKIFFLVRTKPKFRTLLTSTEEVAGYGSDEDRKGLAFVKWVAKQVVPLLEYLIKKPQVPESLTCLSLKVTAELLMLGYALVDNDPERYDKNPFALNVKSIGRLLCDEKIGMLVRDEAQKVGRLSYANGGELLCRELVRNCRNQYGLQLALEIGALNDKENVSILIRRIQLMDKAQGKQNSRETEMLDTTDNFPTNLLRAIYENAMNIRNTYDNVRYASKSGTDEGKVGHEMGQKNSFYVAHQEGALVQILRACDTYESNRISDHSNERSTELLETVSTLLEIKSDSALILDLALRPLTLEGLRTVAAWTSNYSEDTWLKCLFPLIRSEIAKMNVQGVSGDELEQEIVDILRDCARIKYLHNGGGPTPGFRFADELFALMLDAIQHGYIETEGFPRICAQMLLVHSEDAITMNEYNSSSNKNANEYNKLSGYASNDKGNRSGKHTKGITIEGLVDNGMGHGTVLGKWLKMAFDDDICHKHKTRRAILEIAMSLVGLNSTSWGLDSDSLNKELGHQVLSILAAPRHNRASLEFWNEIIRSFPSFLEEQNHIIPALLFGIEAGINAMIFNTVIDAYHWGGIVETLTALASRITSEHAAQLFELFLKVIAMSPPSDVEQDTNARTMYSDTCLSHIVAQIEVGTHLSSYAVQEALKIGGTKTRIELAKHKPWSLLTDSHPLVREAAMRSLSKCDLSIIYQCIDDIIFASNFDNCDYTDNSEGEKDDMAMYDLNIARGIKKILPILPQVAPQYVGVSLERLVWSAKITAENHPQTKPDRDVLKGIDDVLYSTDAGALLKYFLTRDGVRLISKLSKLSPSWAVYLNNMKNQGYIQEAQRRGSRTDEGKQRSGSVSLVQEDEAATRLLSMKEKDFIESANILCENLDRKVHTFVPTETSPISKDNFLVGNVVSSSENTYQTRATGKASPTMRAKSSGSGSDSKTSDRKTSNPITSATARSVTHNAGAMNLSYTRMREDRELNFLQDTSNSWDALLQARDASFVWNRSNEKREASLPVVKAYKVSNNGNSNNCQDSSAQDSLLRSLPLAPTHEIEMTDAGSKTTDSNNQDYRRKVAL